MRRMRVGLTALIGLSALGGLPACQSVPANTQAAVDGAVAVRIQLPRRLQAVTADVARVSVRLDNLNQVPYSYERSLDRSAIDAGQAVTFSGLRRGTNELALKAYDADGRVIGEARDFVNVSGNGVDQRSVRLVLHPNYTEAPTTGDVEALIEFPDLPTTGSVIASYPTPLEYATAMAADHAGAVWLADEDRLLKVAPDGQVLVDKRLGGGLYTIYHLAVDSQNNVWAAVANAILKLGPDGTQLASAPSGVTYQFAIGADDHVWAPGFNGVRKYKPDGTLAGYFRVESVVGSTIINAMATNVAVDDAAGVVWVNCGYKGPERLMKFALDGTFLGDMLAIGGDTRVHPDGHLWAVSGEDGSSSSLAYLHRTTADGTTKSRTPAGIFWDDITFDAHGDVWIARGTQFNNVYKVSADGTPLGVNTIEGNCDRIAAAPDGTLWAHGLYKLHRLAP
ncbi:hypothetical protein D3C72_868240 [compost metagenome]